MIVTENAQPMADVFIACTRVNTQGILSTEPSTLCASAE